MSAPLTSSGPWPAIAPGARIAVIAPSGPFDREKFELGLSVLRSRYDVEMRADIYTREGYLAGTDERRAEELNHALSDPRIDAILTARGGYGAMRLLPHLDLSPLARRPKLLVGFSDITALHAQWTIAGVGSLHATMVAKLGGAPPALQQRWLDAMEGRFARTIGDLVPLTKGRAEGRLFGGNLATLCALLGTRFAPPFSGGVLFLEDVGERPYRLDRLLTTLRLAGHLHQVSAIVVGQFTDSIPGADGVSAPDVLRKCLSDLPCPVVMDLQSGHLDDNLELAFGRHVGVDADPGSLTLLD